MPPQNFIDALFERSYMEGPNKAKNDGNMVSGIAGFQLVEKPETLLTE
jgi:hypothetical protein